MLRRHPLSCALVGLLAGCAPSAPPQAPVAAEEEVPLPPITGSGSSFTVTTHQPSEPADAAKHVEGCKKNDGPACHAAALDAYYKPRSPENDRAAFDLFKKACDGGYAPSCNGLGAMYASGRGTREDPVRAAELFRSSCIAGAPTGCQHLADALERGEGVTQDAAAAARATARGKCVFEVDLGHASLASCPAL